MQSKFFSLDEEKQNRIMNAALKVFAEKGYRDASTNEIVKEANISKGLLFHYFRNKKELYLFLYDHSVKIVLDEFYKKINLTETDFLVRIRHALAIKWLLMGQYPRIFKFLECAYLEMSDDIRNDLDKRNKDRLQENAKKLFEGLDTSKFRNDVDVQKAIKTVVWTFQGLADEVIEKIKLTSGSQMDYEQAYKQDYEQAFVEADAYIDMFKICFYK